MQLELCQPGTLTLICADLDARPLFWTDRDRERHGYEPQAAAIVAAAMGISLQWCFLRWADFQPALFATQADAIWCGCAITPERQLQYAFSRPYAIFDEAVLVRRGERVRGPSGLRGRRVGAIAGSTNMRLAERWLDCERVAFDGTSDDVLAEMLEALRSGAIDAVVDDEPAFGGVADSAAFEIAFVEKTRNRWGAALRPQSIELRAAIDAALEGVVASGELRAVWAHWFGSNPFPL